MELPDGRNSEWNEGMLKSSRLDLIQINMNYLKSNPLKLTSGEFNYVLWFKHVELLCDEGHSKYSTKEREKVSKLRQLIKDVIDIMPPTSFVRNENMGNSSAGYLIDKDSYKKLSALILRFELLIKDLNDAHGLTTKNTEDKSRGFE